MQRFDAVVESLLEEIAHIMAFRLHEVQREVEGAIAQQTDRIDQLQMQLAEMRGALDVLRAKGAPGVFHARGTYDAAKTYYHGDVVAYNGSSFVATRDGPGDCPGGGGWQLVASAGKRGSRGERGAPGIPGERGLNASVPTPSYWHIDRKTYTAVLRMTNGNTLPPLELRGLFEHFIHEMQEAAK